MDRLPSVWGRHEEADIDPIMVRGKLITSIAGAPATWEDRLRALGFRLVNQSWLRLGSLAPAELEYLSPEIRLIGLRPQDVIDLHEDEESQPRLPFDVQDALLGLWQRQPASVLVCLSMEHGKHYTRSQAWGFVETALDGELTPETDSLLGLTFAKMHRDGSFSKPAMEFALSIGWNRPEPSAGRRHVKQIMVRGESLQWADRDGIIHAGRLARRLMSSDVGAWVYRDAPHWRGGYVVAAPIWIERPQIQFSSGIDWQPAEAIPGFGEPRQHDAISLISDIEMPEVERIMLVRLINSQRIFPENGWRELHEKLCDHVETVFPGRNQEEMQSTLPWLEQLEQSLRDAAKHYHGNDLDACFYIMRSAGGLDLALFAGGTKLVLGAPIRHALQEEDGVLRLGAAAMQAEETRRRREHEIRESASEVGRRFNAETMLFAENSLARRAGAWESIASKTHDMTSEKFIRYASILFDETDVEAVCADTCRTSIGDAFQVRLRRSALDIRVGECVMVEVLHAKASLRTAEEIVDRILLGEDAPKEKNSLAPKVDRDIFEVIVSVYGKQDIAGLADVEKASIIRGGKRQRSIFIDGADEAMSTLRSVLDVIGSEIHKADFEKLEVLRVAAERYPLRERFQAATAQLLSSPDDELSGYLSAEMGRQLKKRSADWSEDYREKILKAALVESRKPDIQGLLVISSLAGGRSERVRCIAIPMSGSEISQSRKAELESKAVELKARYRLKGSTAVIDTIAFVDPELCAILNGEELAVADSASKASEGGYDDTGVVAGWAMKDIRGLDRATLLHHADGMSDGQKEKYITRELIWPRKSFEEMKEAGIPLDAAFSLDLLWKSLPRHPKSTARAHVSAFIELITSMKEHIEPLYESVQGAKSTQGFAVELMRASAAAAEQSFASEHYPYRERLVKGYRPLEWSSFNPSNSWSLQRKLESLSWDDVLKSKRTIKSSESEVSRVTRGEVVRIGPDYRSQASLTPEDFIRTFGFSGVEFGNWTNQKEREKHVNFAYDSMLDFARIMGWEPMALSLGGKLGLCFGSRGRGGKRPANAHFEPANMAINLTRKRGDGALAHEFFHAVACHYGKLATGSTVDLVDTFGYSLQKPGAVPQPLGNGLRPELHKSFFDLMVSIMRMPAKEADVRDISSYTEQSSMLLAALAEDGASGDYWARPREMFARAMEIWFKERLAELGERNDYLVREGKSSELSPVYPCEKHLARINHFVSPLIEAVKQEVCKVQHPFLGEIAMPVLCSEMRARRPIGINELQQFAQLELERLFQAYTPDLQFVDGSHHRAGMYDIARDLVVLSAAHADRETFYHEAWHACHEKLLTVDEHRGLEKLFSQGGSMEALVVDALMQEGASEKIIAHACSDTKELQAYAFQLWAVGKLVLRDALGEFYRVKGFADDTVAVGELFGPAEAEQIFARFLSGELVIERQRLLTENSIGSGERGDGDILYIPLGDEEPRREAPAQRAMRMC